jgi:cholecystokinin A receptor/hypocretin (orexin) receptor 2
MQESCPEDESKVYDKSLVGQEPTIAYIGALMVVGFIGNIHVLVVFSTHFKKNSTYVIFVLSLAVIDFLMCSVHMPLEILDLCFPYNFFDSGMCKVFRSNQSVLTMTSVFILSLIALDRYRHVCYPMRKQWSVSEAKKMIAACVCLSVIVSIPVPLLFGPEEVKVADNVTKTICFVGNTSSTVDVLSVVYVLFLNVAFVSSLAVLLFSYISIGVTMRRQAKTRMLLTSLMLPNSNFKASKTKCTCFRCFFRKKFRRVEDHSLKSIGHHRFHRSLSSSQRQFSAFLGRSPSTDNRRATKVLSCVTLVFIVSFLPYVMLGLLVTLGQDLRNLPEDPAIVVYRLSVRLLLINNVSNCFVYGIFDQRFKKACFQIYSKFYNCTKRKLTNLVKQ